MDELHYLTISDLAPLIERRQLSPVEVTQAQLDRIDDLDPQIMSYATVTAERALATAQAAEHEIAAGRYRGPLHGVPIGVKDLCFTDGVATMAGSAAYRDHIPTFDATVVSRLAEAGAVSLGKLNLTEGAMAGYNPDFDIPINPWGPLDRDGDERWAGVSSSGSAAAVAAGLCYASLGTDTGGSIRTPAAACGIAGLKPTFGRVSRHGVMDLGASLDHVGPFARCTADAAIVLNAIAGPDPADPTSWLGAAPDFLEGIGADIARLRLGYDADYATIDVDPEVTEGVTAALALLVDAGATVVNVEVPRVDGADWYRLCAAEAAMAHVERYADRADDFGPYFREFLDVGHAVTGIEYAQVHVRRLDVTARLHAMFTEIDVLICPSMPTPAYVAPSELLWGSMAQSQSLRKYSPIPFTGPANFSGFPTLSLPSGMSSEHMPLSVQFMGRPLDEALLCRVGNRYEQQTDWHNQHPLP